MLTEPNMVHFPESMWSRLSTGGGLATRPYECEHAAKRRLAANAQDAVQPHLKDHSVTWPFAG
jgi:hypothetical protein